MDIENVQPDVLLEELFVKAKATDEFEFCCSLLRIRGMEDAGWDPLQESEQLARQLMWLSNGPIDDTFRLRLNLFLYCHMTEMADVYNITANMLGVINGDRYSVNPFMGELHESNRSAKYPNEKALRIKERADALGLTELGEVCCEMLVKEVRNAFYHSDYILTKESFNIRHGHGVLIGHEITHRVPYEWLFPRIQLGINLVLAVLDRTIQHIQSYKEDKVVKGRFGPGGKYVDIQLTTHPEFGLAGFKSPPDPEMLKTDGN